MYTLIQVYFYCVNCISLVTGGAGFIGSHIVNHLLKLGYQVVVLDDLSGGFKENVKPDAELVIGSITDTNLVNKLFEKHSFDYVYHLAAYAAEGLSHFIRKFNYQNNLIGSINLINAAVNHKIKCFVFTSSIAVYGDNDLPFNEIQNPNPEDPYGIAKLAIELDLKAAKKLFGLNFIVFRPHNVYGTKQNIGDKYRNVVGIFMNQILKGEELTLFGKGEQSRAFSFIDDVAPYIANSINVPEALNQTFNIGAGNAITIRELGFAIGKAMGKEPEFMELEKREEVLHAFADHEKFETVFKPAPYLNLEEGLSKMANWVTENGIKSSKEFADIEIMKNLPKGWKE